MAHSSDIPLPSGYFWDRKFRLGDETEELSALVWPRYLIEDSDFPDPELQFQVSGHVLMTRFPVWGIRRETDRKLVACASGLIIRADIDQDTLPNTGWQFAMKALASNDAPNCMCLLAANVHPDYQNLGFSQLLLEEAKVVTLSLGFQTIIGPVRPSSKHLFPRMSMDEYLSKRSDKGELFDPWLRTHLKSGGQMLNVCSESVLVKASFAKWREWLGEDLPNSGDYLAAKALMPLEVDQIRKFAIYREPNVWVRYRL